MPSAPIPFVNNQSSGLEELSGGSPAAINVVMDQSGAVMRRPGVATTIPTIAESADYAPPAKELIGLHETENRNLYAVYDWGAPDNPGTVRKVYRVKNSTFSPLSLTGRGLLSGASRPVFAETEMLLVIAGGAELQRVELSTDNCTKLSSDAPTASHVSAIASRLVANDTQFDRSNVRYSGVANGNTSYAGHTQWAQGVGTAGFFRAEARPDTVVALAETTNEIIAFGSQTMQVFAPDATFVFAPAATKEIGLIAPYSIIKAEQQYAWLDDKRRFVISDGRTFDVISTQIQQTLHDMSTVSDCFGYRVVLGPADVMVWTFPTDGRTFTYQKGVGWGEWMGWSDTAANWSRFKVNCHTLTRDGQNLVGMTGGCIGKLSMSATTDTISQPQVGTETTVERINASVTTGYISHGTDALKHCKRVRFRLRRGTTTSTTAPVAFIGWRDRPGAWQARIPISLGSNADTEPVVELYSLGTYRNRQWFFEFSDSSVELALAGASEEFEVLGN